MADLSYDDLMLIEVAARRRGDRSTAELAESARGGGDCHPSGRARLVLERMIRDGELRVPRLVVGR